MTIVKHFEDLINYIYDLNLNFSKPQMKHLLNLISGLINLEGKKNIANLNRNFLNTTNRSNLSRFLTNSPWDEDELVDKRLKLSSNKLVENQLSSNEPIFLSIDDTLISKSKKSKSIEGMTKLFSHVSGKYEWSHCQVALYAKSGNLSLPLNLKPYLSSDYCEKRKLEFKSKTELAYELIKDLEFTKEHKTYLLMDSWYGAAQLIMNALKEGIHTIVPLKTNRKIFPDGIEIQLKKYEELIDKSALSLVTVKGKDYYTYRYEGNLNGIENAVVLFSYELKDGKLKSPMYILSTDISLSNRQIISYYLNRWEIEVGIKKIV
jgi:SRSO17 transposase